MSKLGRSYKRFIVHQIYISYTLHFKKKNKRWFSNYFEFMARFDRWRYFSSADLSNKCAMFASYFESHIIGWFQQLVDTPFFSWGENELKNFREPTFCHGVHAHLRVTTCTCALSRAIARFHVQPRSARAAAVPNYWPGPMTPLINISWCDSVPQQQGLVMWSWWWWRWDLSSKKHVISYVQESSSVSLSHVPCSNITEAKCKNPIIPKKRRQKPAIYPDSKVSR